VTPTDWERLKPLFEQAAALPDTERQALVEKICLEDSDLGRMLKELLGAGEAIGPFDDPFIDLHKAFQAASGDDTTTLSGPAGENILAGRFRLLRHVGKGGMGDVYEAEDIQLKERVALKTIRPDIAADPSVVANFKREILLGKKVTHPNVCRIHDLGLTQSDSGHQMFFLTMEFLSGETLSSRIKRGPLTVAEALPLIGDLADGLAAAHDAGVIHRDFKSGNVMLVKSPDRRRAVITDFGLATALRTSGELSDLTKSGVIRGTPRYMAPEQIKGEEVTPAADIYALGVLMYEMLTGRCPFTGSSDISVALKHIGEQPKPPSESAPLLDSNWDRVILGCLQKNPKDRLPSAKAVKSALMPLRSELSSVRGGYRRAARALLMAGIAVAAAVIVLTLELKHTAARVGQDLYNLVVSPAGGPVRRVLIADIENHTGEAVLDHTVREFLAGTLEQSAILREFPDGELPEALRRMGRPPGTDIGTQLAIDLCQREGLYAVIVGSVTRIGDEYAVMFRALDCRGEVVASATEGAQGREQIIESIEKASRELRKSLGESAESITASLPLERVTSPSLQAVQYYSLGKRSLYDGNPEEAINLFQRAIETDPSFAMAHDYAGIAFDHLDDFVAERRELATAVSLSDRVAEPEKLKILGDYALAIQDFTQAVKYYQLLCQLKPDMAAAHLNLGQAYLDELNYERALAETDAAIRLDHAVGPEDNAAEILFMSGRTQEAMQRAGAVLNSHPDDPRALYVMGRCRLARGETDAARAIFDRLSASDGEGQSMGYAALADMALDRGQIDEARSELRRALVADEKAHNPYGIALRKLELEAVEPESGCGQKGEPSDPTDNQDDNRLLILSADLCHDPGSADRLRGIVAVLERHRISHETATVQSFLGIANSRLALIEKRRKAAIDFALAAVQFENSAFAVDHLAQIYAGSGMDKEAIAGYEEVLSRANERMETYDGPAFRRLREIHRELAGLYRKTGDEKRAEMHGMLAAR
jgi:eukaryotic-like serine/threonine-protein kinase